MSVQASKPLAERVAVVTGGGRGIGRAIALALADAGADVAVNYSRGADAAGEVVAEIERRGRRALAVGFDVADEAAVDQGFRQIFEFFGSRLDILVNNAGIAVDSLLVRTKPEDWARTIGINLTGAFNCARSAAKPMMKARFGRIVNISSVIGESGNAGQAAYSASKSGLFGLTKSLAQELGSRGITVNAITPGYIVTDMTAGMPAEQTEKLLESIPLGRLGESEDVAQLVAFLSGPGAGYITGQIIGVNGGMYM